MEACLEEMRTAGLVPTEDDYANYIHCLAEKGHTNALSRAFDALEHLQEQSAPLSCYIYNTVMHLAKQKGRPLLVQARPLFLSSPATPHSNSCRRALIF